MLQATGRTTARCYTLKSLVDERFSVPITPALHEEAVWRERIAPLLQGVKDMVLAICAHGVTQMIQNVLAHAAASRLTVRVSRNPAEIMLLVSDDGGGLFTKLQSDLHLDDPRQALRELVEGRVTVDPKRHSGNGLFFTSRLFDRFAIISGPLSCVWTNEAEDGLEVIEHEPRDGTSIVMAIAVNATQAIEEVVTATRASCDHP